MSRILATPYLSYLLASHQQDKEKLVATSAALAVPSVIFTANADFCSGIMATNTPSAPFLKNIMAPNRAEKNPNLEQLPTLRVTKQK